ncbi:SDR family NAD(P)-dependent oxidoreductase [Paenibacillus validus]|uniref:SDR family NAD(P)-dependent oxidoreductase n=1 Tax=Paenibacillus validus TaxID=44253 RepID=A0A7X2ZEA9_9BACL|nr:MULTISPECIES: SDR family oxidoreductase [Paenibacillus]MED4601172.1 SDR family NAD(P)-dependent oxidoreductase [Paenibacillus validus]MED4606860.1 SDR family NAD(P)-dependent oxidoreductase [Paenibacillus validus]MUG72740.1 SDR family NAD(P)-dependent oxidoreductase [Paenibacillus validus]
MVQQKDEIMVRQREMVRQATQQWKGQVDGKVAVVTGGARGIGRVIVEGLLAAGANVVAADQKWDNAEEFRKHLESTGRGMAVQVDVAEDASLDSAYEAVMERFGTVDVLVNNAALVSETLFYPQGHVKTLDTKDSDWETMFKVNTFGVLKAIRRFIRPMLDKGSGSIINVVSSGVLPTHQGGSYFALRPWTVEMPYQATKAATMALTFYLGEEVRGEGVAVNAIMPGHTRASWFDATAKSWSEMGMVYFMRPSIPEHVTPSILFLAGQNGQGVTGRLVYVPEWNYDHGFGDSAAWSDVSLPPEMEEMYSKLEAVMPKYSRSGVSHLPFDAWAALWISASERLASEQGQS